MQHACPLGPSLQKYWDRLSPQERRMQLDAEALYSLIIQPLALQTASITPGDHVIDAFCGAGGSAIGFARSGKRVTAIELEPKRLAMAKHNAALFGVQERIEFIHGDSLQLIPTLSADAIFLAPPWGGPEYSTRERFTLECFHPNGNEILKVALLTQSAVVMQLPRNFDSIELTRFKRPFSVTEDRFDGELLSQTAVIPASVDTAR